MNCGARRGIGQSLGRTGHADGYFEILPIPGSGAGELDEKLANYEKSWAQRQYKATYSQAPPMAAILESSFAAR